MDHEENQDVFDETYAKKEDFFGRPYREFQDYFSSFPKGSALDVGCGQGRDALFLASIGFRVTAVDSSEVAIQQMMKKAKERGLGITGNTVDAFTFEPEEQFDVVLFDMLLHAFSEQQQKKLLKRYVQCLTKEGVLCIVFPDDMVSDHFLGLLESFGYTLAVKDEILIKDVPSLPGEEKGFTFNMLVVQVREK